MKMTTCWSGFAATSWALRCSVAAAKKTTQSARCMETRADPIMGDEEKAVRVGQPERRSGRRRRGLRREEELRQAELDQVRE